MKFNMGYIGNLNTHRGFVGKMGEDLACNFLISKGHIIIERNFRNRVGEIDIVSYFNGSYHFVEVKTVTMHKNTVKISAESHMDSRKLNKTAILAELYMSNLVSRHVTNSESSFFLGFIGVYLENHELRKINYIESLEI